MRIECPSCRHVLKLKGVKAGRYTPKCPRCGKPFLLLVSGSDDRFQYTAQPEAAEPAAPAPQAIPVADLPPAALPVGPERTIVGAEDDSADFEVDLPESAAEAPPPALERLPAPLGDYEVLKPLGRGGMGTVYLARQVKLDRPVALKVMNARWASDPVFLARFTREALAAGQLVHHNIVQIYDVGSDRGVHFFSMEFVNGRTLAELVKEHGKLDAEEAAGYVLQAARGLAFAHERGMVHRDVKPDNLMLNDHGVVKVADLGLVKTPGITEAASAGPESAASGVLGSLPSVTRADTTMGTPNFMAPEQGRNASTVDGRADVYSLGCTLYYLLTGRPPFRGRTALEVLLQHLNEVPVPPEQRNERVPKDLSAIVLKMMAKKPEHRHADMAAVIHDLEHFLGLRRAGSLGPTPAQAEELESCGRRFNEVAVACLRSRVLLGFGACCASAVALGAFFSFRLAIGALTLSATALLFSFLVSGVTARTYLFVKVREFLLDGAWGDWVTLGAGGLLFAVFLFALGLLKFWLGFCVLGAALALAYHLGVVRPLAAQRAGIVAEAQGLLKGLRLGGLAEESLRQFVCVHAGARWEEFFEDLFGYELTVQARARWGRADGRPRPTHAAWRDPIVRWIEARQQARKEAREHRLLRAVEQKELEAQAVAAPAPPPLAVAAPVIQAAPTPAPTALPAPVEPAVAQPAPVAVALPVVPVTLRIEVAEKPRPPREEPAGPGLLSVLFGVLFGPRVRFLLGAALLAATVLWMSQNELVPGEETDLAQFAEKLAGAKPLDLLAGWPATLLSGFNPAGAGLLLVLSALTRTGKIVFFLTLAAIVALAGPLAGIPDVGPVKASYVSLIAALVLAEFGIVFESAARGY